VITVIRENRAQKKKLNLDDKLVVSHSQINSMTNHYCRLILLELAHLQIRQKKLIEKGAVKLLSKMSFPYLIPYF
jgi:hypothetical protein